MSIREIGARAGVREEKSVLEFMEKGVMLVNE
jgi:hypothetical protein